MPEKASYDPPANTIIHMQLTVLVDNNTAIDKYYLGEPGLSFYIEAVKKFSLTADTRMSAKSMLNVWEWTYHA